MEEGAVTGRGHGRPAGERRLPVTPTGARTYLELLHGVGAHHRCRLLQLSHLAGGELWLRDALPGGDSGHARDPATGVIMVTRSRSRGGASPPYVSGLFQSAGEATRPHNAPFPTHNSGRATWLPQPHKALAKESRDGLSAAKHGRDGGVRGRAAAE